MSPSVPVLPSPRLSMEIPSQAKHYFVAGKFYHIFFPFYCSCECRQISSLLPFVTSFSSSRSKGVQDPKYIWLQQFLREKLLVQLLWPKQEITPLCAMKCWNTVFQTWGHSFAMQQLFWIPRYPPKPETLKLPSSFRKIGCCSIVHMYELRGKLGGDMWREWDEVMNEINLTLL